MGKVLVTGINGIVGSYVYEALKNMKQEVAGAVTSIAKAKDRFNDIDLVEFDFLNEKTFDNALNMVDRVFLMRPPQMGNPKDLYPFINAMKEKGIKLVVFLSLMGAEKNIIAPHHKIEKYVERSGLPYCHIRPGFFMQNLSGIHAKEIKELNEILIPAGRSKCSFIDAKDIGKVTAKILSEHTGHRNTAYTITGPEALDYYQIAEIFSDVLGRNIKYTNPTWLKFRQYMVRERNLDKKMANVMVMLYFMTRLGTASKVDHTFKKVTGVEPRTFKQFVEDNIGYWKVK